MFVAGTVALVAGLRVAHQTDGITTLVVGGLAVGLMYVGALSLLGIGEDDELALQSLRPGARTSAKGTRP